MRWNRLFALAVLLAAAAVGMTLLLRPGESYRYHLTYVGDQSGGVPRPDLKLFGAEDSGGKVRRADDYRGDVVVLYAGYTHCPNVCPTTLAKLHAARANLSKDTADRIKVLFVSVDPRRDTEKVLGQYVHAFDSSFTGLRVSGQALKGFESLYGIDVTYGTPDENGAYAVNHSGAMYIFGGDGHLQLIGSPADTVDDLTADLRHLAG